MIDFYDLVPGKTYTVRFTGVDLDGCFTDEFVRYEPYEGAEDYVDLVFVNSRIGPNSSCVESPDGPMLTRWYIEEPTDVEAPSAV